MNEKSSYFVREYKISKHNAIQRRITLANMKVGNEIWGHKVLDIKVKECDSYICIIYYIEGEDDWGGY